MNYVRQQVVLSGGGRHGHRLPPRPIGHALVAIPQLIRQSVDMAFRGQSTARGRCPQWLRAASDVALLDVSDQESPVLTFDAPTLGESAPELYRQGEFFWTNRPDPADTGFDILGDVLGDVAKGNAESDRFDSRLLHQLWGARKIIGHSYSQLAIVSRRHGADDAALLNSETLGTAKQLHDRTPKPQAAIIVGNLDMIRYSTQTFALLMADGQEVRCVMAEGEVEGLMPYFKREVVVTGQVVFRASGRPLRIEAESVRPATESDRFFAKIPRPNAQRFDLRRTLREQGSKRGVAAIIGQWPGDETDEEIEEWLEEVS